MKGGKSHTINLMDGLRAFPCESRSGFTIGLHDLHGNSLTKMINTG